MNLQDKIFVSEMIALAIINSVILFIGFYLIPDVDETIYPYVASTLIAQATIGIIVIEYKRVLPTLSRRLIGGNIDIAWGFKYFWWTLWWPMFLKTSDQKKI